MAKKSVLYYGMCHKLYYMEYLSKCSEFSKEYIFIDIPNVNDIHHDSYEILKRKDIWNYCDVLLCTEFDEFLAAKWGIMPTKEIKKLISDKCKVITITPAAFKGYFPQTIDAQSNSINSKICEYFTWGDKFLNKFCRDGKDIKEIIKKLQSTEFLPKDKILKYINDSLENLRFTEESCDVKIADYVEANYNKRVLYFSPTHGNDEIMQVLSRRLLLSLGINERITENKSVSIVYDNHEVPVYPAVLNAIGIYSENSQRKVNCGNYFNDKTKLSFIEYIKLYYEKWQEYKDIK